MAMFGCRGRRHCCCFNPFSTGLSSSLGKGVIADDLWSMFLKNLGGGGGRGITPGTDRGGGGGFLFLLLHMFLQVLEEVSQIITWWPLDYDLQWRTFWDKWKCVILQITYVSILHNPILHALYTNTPHSRTTYSSTPYSIPQTDQNTVFLHVMARAVMSHGRTPRPETALTHVIVMTLLTSVSRNENGNCSESLFHSMDPSSFL